MSRFKAPRLPLHSYGCWQKVTQRTHSWSTNWRYVLTFHFHYLLQIFLTILLLAQSHSVATHSYLSRACGDENFVSCYKMTVYLGPKVRKWKEIEIWRPLPHGIPNVSELLSFRTTLLNAWREHLPTSIFHLDKWIFQFTCSRGRKGN